MRRLYGKTLKIGFSKSLYSIAASGGSAPVSEYQEWDGYPDSPRLTTEYPYQCVYSLAGIYYLIISGDPFYKVYTGGKYRLLTSATTTAYGYYITTKGNAWIDNFGPYDDYAELVVATNDFIFEEANNDIYGEIELSTVVFAKTT
jgi:hypothetical protein